MSSDQEVLQAAIEKAIEGGYTLILDNTRRDLFEPARMAEWLVRENRTDLVLFDIDFATALWSHEPTYDMTHTITPDNSYKMNVCPAWQYHLQQLAISEDRIDYLRRYI